MSSGVYPSISLIEYAQGISLTDEEWVDPDVQELLLYVVKVIYCHNDIVSFEKEWVDQGKNINRMCNVVAGTVLFDKCTVEEAMIKVAKIYTDLEYKVKGQIE